MRLWEAVLEREPNNQNVLSRLGDAWLRMGDEAHGERFYRRSLAIGFDPWSMLGLASVLRRKGQLSEAAVCCQRVVEEMPTNLRALRLLAGILDEAGRTAESREIGARIEEVRRNEPSVAG